MKETHQATLSIGFSVLPCGGLWASGVVLGGVKLLQDFGNFGAKLDVVFGDFAFGTGGNKVLKNDSRQFGGVAAVEFGDNFEALLQGGVAAKAKDFCFCHNVTM